MFHDTSRRRSRATNRTIGKWARDCRLLSGGDTLPAARADCRGVQGKAKPAPELCCLLTNLARAWYPCSFHIRGRITGLARGSLFTQLQHPWQTRWGTPHYSENSATVSFALWCARGHGKSIRRADAAGRFAARRAAVRLDHGQRP